MFEIRFADHFKNDIAESVCHFYLAKDNVDELQKLLPFQRFGLEFYSSRNSLGRFCARHGIGRRVWKSLAALQRYCFAVGSECSDFNRIQPSIDERVSFYTYRDSYHLGLSLIQT